MGSSSKIGVINFIDNNPALGALVDTLNDEGTHICEMFCEYDYQEFFNFYEIVRIEDGKLHKTSDLTENDVEDLSKMSEIIEKSLNEKVEELDKSRNIINLEGESFNSYIAECKAENSSSSIAEQMQVLFNKMSKLYETIAYETCLLYTIRYAINNSIVARQGR